MKKILFLLMALSLVFVTSVTCFASENYESFEVPSLNNYYTQYIEEYPYWVLYENSQGVYEVTFFTAKPYVDSNDLLTFNGKGYVQFIHDPDNNTWILNHVGSNSTTIQYVDIYHSSNDLYQGDYLINVGVPDFWELPKSLYEEVNSVVGDSMTNDFTPKITANFVTLVSVAVVLLACFVVLVILKKKSVLHL